jgi:two-component sensor histidine kinase
LTADLFSSYNLQNKNICLNLDFEQIYLGLDTAIPLGIIVNELVTNSLKHAFPNGNNWEISISLKKIKDLAANKEISRADSACSQEKDFQYTLTVADNGRGIPEEINFRNADSLGLQLVNILVEQIEGCLELRRNQGTEFCIGFNDI